MTLRASVRRRGPIELTLYPHGGGILTVGALFEVSW